MNASKKRTNRAVAALTLTLAFLVAVSPRRTPADEPGDMMEEEAFDGNT